jgi:hypothetical protein
MSTSGPRKRPGKCEHGVTPAFCRRCHDAQHDKPAEPPPEVPYRDGAPSGDGVGCNQHGVHCPRDRFDCVWDSSPEVPCACITAHNRAVCVGWCKMPVHPVKSFVCIHCGAEAFCPKCDEPEPQEGQPSPKYRLSITHPNGEERVWYVDKETAKLSEPQEGARPLLGPTGSDPGTPGEPAERGPAPSCDSAELAAALQRANDANDALLRVVDEMRAKDRSRIAYITELAGKVCNLVSERDELRAKLAVAETRERELGDLYTETEAKLAESQQNERELYASCQGFEAKLAEAEAGAEELADDFDRERKRAEAAEARQGYAEGRRRTLEGIVSRCLETEPEDIEQLRVAFKKWCAPEEQS